MNSDDYPEHDEVLGLSPLVSEHALTEPRSGQPPSSSIVCSVPSEIRHMPRVARRLSTQYMANASALIKT